MLSAEMCWGVGQQTENVYHSFVDDVKELQKVGYQQPECEQRDLVVDLVVQKLHNQRKVHGGSGTHAFPYLTLQQRLYLKLNAFDLPQQPLIHTELPQSTFAVPNIVRPHIAVGSRPFVEVIRVIAYVLPLNLGYRCVKSVAIPSNLDLPEKETKN